MCVWGAERSAKIAQNQKWNKSKDCLQYCWLAVIALESQREGKGNDALDYICVRMCVWQVKAWVHVRRKSAKVYAMIQ